MKTFTFEMTFSAIGTVSIQVPDDFTIDQAIDFANETKDEIGLPLNNWNYLSDSDQLDFENCSFE